MRSRPATDPGARNSGTTPNLRPLDWARCSSSEACGSPVVANPAQTGPETPGAPPFGEVVHREVGLIPAGADREQQDRLVDGDVRPARRILQSLQHLITHAQNAAEPQRHTGGLLRLPHGGRAHPPGMERLGEQQWQHNGLADAEVALQGRDRRGQVGFGQVEKCRDRDQARPQLLHRPHHLGDGLGRTRVAAAVGETDQRRQRGPDMP